MYALFVTFIVYYTITYNTRGKANCTGMSATYNKYSIFVRVRAGSHGCLRSRLRFTTIADHHGQYSSETKKKYYRFSQRPHAANCASGKSLRYQVGCIVNKRYHIVVHVRLGKIGKDALLGMSAWQHNQTLTTETVPGAECSGPN